LLFNNRKKYEFNYLRKKSKNKNILDTYGKGDYCVTLEYAGHKLKILINKTFNKNK